LGAFILQSLLRKFPDVKVYCLVRANNFEKGKERIVSNLENHHIWEESFGQRIIPLLGDLGKPKLGLTDDEFKKLASVDAVIHNGATVHWVYPYQKLKATNVESTKWLLVLCTCSDRVIPFHFVSSTSVFDSDYYINNIDAKVMENDNLEGGKYLTVGYAQSKWVSERIVLLAKAKNVPVTIIRPGYVVGHSRTGVTNADDFLWRLMKGCIQLGSVPIMRNKVNMCPVDYVADLIVHVASKKECLGNAFHTVNPSMFRFDHFFQLLMDYGYQVAPIDYMKWRQDLMDLTISTSDNALYPLIHFVLDDLPTKSKSPDLDSTNAEIAISDSTIRCPPMPEVMGIYFSYLVQSGFFPPPPPGINSKKILPKLELEAKILVRSDRGSSSN
jgi:L-aminoadipate-semialdehyde dehydrogenase